jgi:hypothetical protein
VIANKTIKEFAASNKWKFLTLSGIKSDLVSCLYGCGFNGHALVSNKIKEYEALSMHLHSKETGPAPEMNLECAIYNDEININKHKLN